MRKMISLTKLFINASMGVSLFFYNKTHNKKEFSKQLFTIIIVSVALIPASVFYIFYMTGLYLGLQMLNQTSVFLSLAYVIATVFILIFGIMSILSEFYFSKNFEEILSLPIKSGTIILSKFLSILLLDYVFAAFVFLPPLIIYGIGQGMGIGYAILSLLVFLSLPLLPMALETILIMVIMTFTSFKGRQDVFQIVFLIVGIGIILGGEFYFVSQIGSSGKEADIQTIINGMIQNNQSLLHSIGNYFPLSFLIAWGLNTINLMSIIWVLMVMGISTLSVIFMVFIGKKLYFSVLINSQSSPKGKKLSDVDQQKALGKTSGKAMSVFLMDIRLLLRTPVYMLNNAGVVIILPLCLILSFSFATISEEAFPNLWELYQKFEFLANFCLIAFFLFVTAASAITATSFSREGQSSWLTRIVPISSKDQIIGRTCSGIIIQSLGIIFTTIVLLFYLPLTLSSILITVILGILGSLPLLFFGLFIDMNRPLLAWDNPQKAVKNNMNVVISLFVGTTYIFLLIAGSGALGFFINAWLGYGLYTLISLLMSYVFFNLVNKNLEECLLNF